MRQVLGSYINGNYEVTIYDDGTKVRKSKSKKLVPAFAENCDVKITDKCDGECPFCYEGCNPLGKHADLFRQEWVYNLHPYTELALNGNDLSHPQLLLFLQYLTTKNIIANITVNQKHFMKYKSQLHEMVDKKLIYGVGVSLVSVTDEFVSAIQEFPNAVIHTIAGLLSATDIEKLSNKGLKLLILGYKEKGRGIEFFNTYSEDIKSRQEILKRLLPSMQSMFEVISFDNLALEQLDIKNTLNISDDDWNQLYMGDDGKFTFYIDMVNQTFAKNSLSTKTKPIMSSVDDMFNAVRKMK